MSLTDAERTAAKARVTKALKDEIGRDLLDAEPVRMVEASPAGIGKTTTTLQALKAHGLDRVSAWFLEPTLDLAAEAAGKAAAMGLKVEVVRGRLAEGNPVMCHRPNLVEDAQKQGITNIQGALCRG